MPDHPDRHDPLRAALLRKLATCETAYQDPIVHACATRLDRGDDVVDVIVETLDMLAEDRARHHRELARALIRSEPPVIVFDPPILPHKPD